MEKATYAELVAALEKLRNAADKATHEMNEIWTTEPEQSRKLDSALTVINQAIGAADYWIEQAKLEG